MAKISIPNHGELSIFEHELEEKFIHSGGSGGQNVNKVATCVQLRFDIRASPSLAPPVKERLEKLAGKRVTQHGVLVLEAKRFRTQERNRADARRRLLTLIGEAAKPPPAKRRATKPSKGVLKRRTDLKTKRGAIKKLRSGLNDAD